MSLSAIFTFVLGLLLLIGGAEILVRGAARLAFAVGISPLVVGLTVVAFGTSAPELAVSLQSAFNDQAGIAVGNVVGSNIFNILLILGLSAAITPLVVHAQLVRLDIPLLIGISLLVILFAANGVLGRLEGAILFGGAVLYTGFLLRQSRRETAKQKRAASEYPASSEDRTRIDNNNADNNNNNQNVFSSPWFSVAQIVLGLVLLVLGARWLVQAAVAIAATLGISEVLIGLTIVAGGTSLPEVATSVIAALRGERDIAVGNAVGSNLFNLLVVLGMTALVTRDGIPIPPGVLAFDLPIMTIVAVACLPIFFTGYRIARWEGFLFLGYYVAYITYLILQSGQSDSLVAFQHMILYFLAPLTLITLLVTLGRDLSARRLFF